MTLVELKLLHELLLRVKDPDGHIARALAFVQKDIAFYEARKNQLRDTYELERPW